MSKEAYWKGEYRSKKNFEQKLELTGLGAKTFSILPSLNSCFLSLLSHFLTFFKKSKTIGVYCNYGQGFFDCLKNF